MNGTGSVTQISTAIEQGDAEAVNVLLPIVYEELRLLAAQRLSRKQPGQTLQATALVHEACLRLVQGEPQNWSGRGHFFAAAAEAMRRILVETGTALAWSGMATSDASIWMTHSWQRMWNCSRSPQWPGRTAHRGNRHY